MASQVTQVLTQYPLPAPQITDSQDVFSQRAFSKAANDVVLVTQINTLASQINTVATEVNTNSNTAATNATSAANSATSAQSSANAAASIANVWVSGSSYTLGTIVYSPVNFQTYRAKTTHSGITTDPSSDATRWTALVATINNTLTSTSTTDALSAAQGKALQDSKQATLVSGTNIKTIGGTTLLDSGDIPFPSSAPTLITSLTPANGVTSVVVNNIPVTYSRILVVSETSAISLSASSSLRVRLSVDNGGTYDSQIFVASSSGTSVGVYCDFFDTKSNRAKKAFTIVGGIASTTRALDSATNTTAINAIKITTDLTATFTGVGSITILGYA